MFSNLRTTTDWLKFLMPFANEFANVFTQAGLTTIYKHHPTNMYETLSKAFVDFIALSGIVWNVAFVASTNKSAPLESGMIKGIVLLVFAFLIPNLFIEDMLRMTCKWVKNFACKKTGILIFGVLIIAGLLAMETVSHHYVEGRLLVQKNEK